MSRTHHFLAAVALALSLNVAAVRAGAPSVQFDTDPTVSVCDVTTPEFAALNPGERMIEVHVQVSSLIRHGREEDLIQFLYSFESPELTARVVDYLPQTTLATDVVGSLGIEEQDEHSHQLGLNLSTSQPGLGQASASGSTNGRNSQRVQYALLPPLELLAASGTINRGSGVYFKLKPSRRTSLEGASDFVLVLRVPQEWRADVLRVRCEAVGTERSAVRHLDRDTTFGAAEFTVALYAEGDEAARAAAEQFMLRERRLKETANSFSHVIAETAHPWVGHRWAAELELTEPCIPDGWLNELLHLSPAVDHDRYASRLPAEVDAAVSRYAEAKRVMHSLSGSRIRTMPAELTGEAAVTVADGGQ